MSRRPKSSDSTRPTTSKEFAGVVYHTPPPNSHGRPNWMCLQDIPDEDVPNADEESHIWDGNKKLFVQLLDDMDNIGGVDGLTDGSARRRRKARELFTDWLFRSKKPESPTPQSPQLNRVKKHNDSLHSHRFSGDFTNFDVRIPVSESPKLIPGRLERQMPSRRSCGIIGDRKHPLNNWRHSSVHISNEDEADSGYHSGNSAILNTIVAQPKAPSALTLSRQELKKRIEKFNATNTHGLVMQMPMERNSLFEGSVRVHMNLIRPINMKVCKSPPTFVSTLKRNKKKNNDAADVGETEITFSLPKNTSKVIHINSTTTTCEVVQVLLQKFNICDSPRKFSLYERIELPTTKPTMRKLQETEQPLQMCLLWGDCGDLDNHRFILQENDVGEIMWEAFSLPELESFLNVLDREEKECLKQVREKFKLEKIQITRRMGELEDKDEGKFPVTTTHSDFSHSTITDSINPTSNKTYRVEDHFCSTKCPTVKSNMRSCTNQSMSFYGGGG